MIKTRILLIEDEPDLRTVLADGLRREGHDVLVAGDGVEGLQVFAKEKPKP